MPTEEILYLISLIFALFSLSFSIFTLIYQNGYEERKRKLNEKYDRLKEKEKDKNNYV